MIEYACTRCWSVLATHAREVPALCPRCAEEVDQEAQRRIEESFRADAAMGEDLDDCERPMASMPEGY